MVIFWQVQGYLDCVGVLDVLDKELEAGVLCDHDSLSKIPLIKVVVLSTIYNILIPWYKYESLNIIKVQVSKEEV